jgi:hypothetical protein
MDMPIVTLLGAVSTWVTIEAARTLQNCGDGIKQGGVMRGRRRLPVLRSDRICGKQEKRGRDKLPWF